MQTDRAPVGRLHHRATSCPIFEQKKLSRKVRSKVAQLSEVKVKLHIEFSERSKLHYYWQLLFVTSSTHCAREGSKTDPTQNSPSIDKARRKTAEAMATWVNNNRTRNAVLTPKTSNGVQRCDNTQQVGSIGGAADITFSRISGGSRKCIGEGKGGEEGRKCYILRGTQHIW